MSDHYSLPNFLVIGADRAGTTWIQRNLRLHPDVFMPRRKELDFFNADYDLDLDYYRKFFRNVGSQKRIGEATPSYLSTPKASSSIKMHLPDVQMIVSLRNPVDRLYSDFWNMERLQPHKNHKNFRDIVQLEPGMIEEGYYFDHLQRYFKLFPRKRFHIVLFDDLVANPINFLSSIYAFLKIDPKFISPLAKVKLNSATSKKHVGKHKYYWILHRIFFQLGFYNLSSKFEIMNRVIVPPLNPDVRKWLIDYVYGEKNLLLGELIGQDLSMWNQIGNHMNNVPYNSGIVL